METPTDRPPDRGDPQREASSATDHLPTPEAVRRVREELARSKERELRTAAHLQAWPRVW